MKKRCANIIQSDIWKSGSIPSIGNMTKHSVMIKDSLIVCCVTCKVMGGIVALRQRIRVWLDFSEAIDTAVAEADRDVNQSKRGMMYV